jgi:hypothetical protein
MFGLTEISYNMGLMLGPLVCGSLSDAFGFEYTAWTLGESHAQFIPWDVSLTFISSGHCNLHGMHFIHLLYT